MKTYTNIYPSPAELAAAFAVLLEKWASHKKIFHVALSGGSTPEVLFGHLAQYYKHRIDWEAVHFFWGDERCVPPDQPESNYRMTQDSLLRHIELPTQNIHRIHGEAEPQAEAERYAREIQAYVPMEEGWPVFDLVLLGLGSDGHTASIFPNQMDLLHSERICDVATYPASGQQRISLTGKVINHAHKVAFLVTGPSKRNVVAEILGKSGDWAAYPASHIRSAGGLYWFLDEAAAAPTGRPGA